ncbi:MAG: twin-arginine translocase TatA/TatE family subunit [Myxococcota bacterium]
MPGPIELVIVLVIIMIAFGAGKLPQVMGALGDGVRQFKAAASEADKVVGELNDSDKNNS